MGVRTRKLRATAGVGATVLIAGWVLSRATTRVANWYVMTDELYYERLAISVAQTGSLLPRIHGELVANVNQLYPVILSFVYGDADVPASLFAAHRLNAFLMASAAIPVYLLARRAGATRLPAVWAAGIAVAVPWMVLSSFLLTEVVAYPAFCWALLAATCAVARASNRLDALALAAIGAAVLARAQFLVLGLVLMTAVVLDSAIMRRRPQVVLRRRPLLAAVSLITILVVLAAAIRGSASSLLGSYSVTAGGMRLDLELLHFTASHLAVLALATGIVPFLFGGAWLVDRLRPTAAVPERAFAAVGCATLLLVSLQVASFNQRFGAGLIKDRYLFYVVPVVLVALAVAVTRAPRVAWWAAIVPAGICVTGFAALPLHRYEKLNVDSPLAMLNDQILQLAGSESWARLMLVVATLVALGLLLDAALFLPRPAVATAVVVIATIALPAGTVYAFHRLFAVNGTNGLPITLDQGGVFGWIDRSVGADGRVAMVRYPVNPPDYWAGLAYWWDVEFWNESIVDTVELHVGSRPEPWTRGFHPRTGKMTEAPATRYVLVHSSDVRLRPAGEVVAFDRGAYLIEAERPWRAAWITTSIYGDGWTRPHLPAAIKVFADPGQRRSLRRFLTVAIASPDQVRERSLTISSNLERWSGQIAPAGGIERLVAVCVPPAGHGTVYVSTAFVSDVYRDPTYEALTGETDRPVGVLLRSIALADESEPTNAC